MDRNCSKIKILLGILDNLHTSQLEDTEYESVFGDFTSKI